MQACVLASLILAAGVAAGNAEDTTDPAVFVRRLADEKFAIRERAAEQLRKLGKAAEPALRAGLKHPDAEVRERCQTLLDEIAGNDREERLIAFLTDAEDGQPLPGWRRFAEVAGKTPAARRSFVTLYRSAGDLLDTAEKAPAEVGDRLAARCKALAPALITSGPEEPVLAEAEALLLVATAERLNLGVPAFNSLCDGLGVLANRAPLKKRFLQDEPSRKLLLAFVQRRWDGPQQERTLSLALAYELKETADWAVGLALSRETPGLTRGWALLVAGQLGGKEQAARLKPLLDDTTAVGERKLGPTTLRAEVRDVALVAVIRLAGRQPADYGFPYLQAIPGLKTLPTPACLGFADAATREAAFKKWKEAPADPKK
jgi:hypothetical protein